MESAGTVRPRDDGDAAAAAAGSGAERSAKKQRTGGGGRGAGYSPQELAHLIALLEEYLPVANREWKALARLHNRQFPSLRRAASSLRRKFASMCRLLGNSDESTLAPDARRLLMIKQRMKYRDDVPEDDDEPDSDDNDGDNENGSVNGSDRRQSAAPTTAELPAQPQETNANAPQYYPDTQPSPPPPPPMSMPMPPQSQTQFNYPSRVQALYSRLSEPNDQRDLMELIKMQLLQTVEDDRRRRAEEHERRDEERRHRQQEEAIREEYRRRWEDERARREEDLRRWDAEREESRRRHEEFMQLILTLVAKNKP